MIFSRTALVGSLGWATLSLLITSAAEPAYSPSQILVQPKAGVVPEALTGFHAAQGHHVNKTFRSLGGLQVLQLRPGASVAAAIRDYRAHPAVAYAEPDFIRSLAATMPNDPRFTNGQSWGLHNTGQNGGLPDADIDAPEAWDILTSAPNVVIAVLDSGIALTHEDLSGNLWTNPLDGSHGWDAINHNNSPADTDGHGTLVSGVLAAVGNNGKGVAGVVWQTQLMTGRCFATPAAGYDSDIIECLEFARTNGAQIVNASFGGSGFSLSLSNAIFAARQQGIIVVCSAGNNALNIDTNSYYPASLEIDNVLSVGASTRSDTLYSLSNWGASMVDLFAPGDQIYSTFNNAGLPYLGPLGGTSYSAPYVAGALVLLKQRFPGEPHTTTIRRVLDNVDPVPAFAGKCVTGGRLNLHRALSPALRLSLALAPTELRITIHAGAPARTVVLEQSADLVAWTPIATNVTSAAGSVTMTNVPGAGGFFRASAAP